MLKTHKATAKRIKKSKNGKLRHSKVCRSHLLTNKGKSTKKHKFGKALSDVHKKNVALLLPYS